MIETVALCKDCVASDPHWPLFRSRLSAWFTSDRSFIVKCVDCEQVHHYHNVETEVEVLKDGQWKSAKWYINHPLLKQIKAQRCHDCWTGFPNAWIDRDKNFKEELTRVRTGVEKSGAALEVEVDGRCWLTDAPAIRMATPKDDS
jgi:Pyruvate/2-oxoacid:ferredoxin oxidoreductase delta subunit